MKPPPIGYSGTPLAKKLGIVAGTCVLAKHAPKNYSGLLEPVPRGVVFQRVLSKDTGIVHLFCTRRATLERELLALRKKLRSDGTVWISWPKQSAKVPTDITEDTIREVALPIGFVDVKVCAVTDVWSGLKLVVRKELR